MATTISIRELLSLGKGLAFKTSSVLSKVCSDRRSKVLGLTLVAGGLSYAYYRYRGDAKDKYIIDQLLNSGYEGLAVEQVEEGEVVDCPAIHLEDREGMSPQDIPSPEYRCLEEIGNEDHHIGVSRVKQPQFIEINGTPIKTDYHRKVKKDGQMKYMNAIIAECKVKFGVPLNTSANHKAIERFAGNQMKSHGVRPTHIRKFLPMIVKMVFIPDKWQIEAERLSGTRTAWKAVMEFLVNNVASVAPREDKA